MINYQELTMKVCELVRQTGTFIADERKAFDMDVVEEKSKASLVSYVDKNAEKMLVDGLLHFLPESGFIAEEGTSTKKGDRFNWIIDPLDGTTNFIHGLAPYAISVALQDEHELVVGIILEVSQNELFYAWKGSKAFLNGNEIHVASATQEKDTLIATGFPYYDFDKLDNYIEVLTHFMQTTRGLRRMGSAAADLAFVACGRFDAFFEHALHSWDVAAGILIVQQAGGKVSDFRGGNTFLFGGEIVVASSSFYDSFFDVVNRHLGK